MSEDKYESYARYSAYGSHFMTSSPNKKNHFLVITENDLEILGGHHAAAMVLSVIKNTHKWKTETDAHNKRANDIAEAHGDNRYLSEDVSINLTVPEIQKRILNFFGRNAIIAAIKLLEAEGLIKQQSNPNPKYRYDNSRYFRFHEGRYAEMLRAMADGWQSDQDDVVEAESLAENDIAVLNADVAKIAEVARDTQITEVVDSLDGLKSNDPGLKSKREEGEAFKNKRTPFKTKPFIMNSSKRIKNINQSPNAGARDDFFAEQQQNADSPPPSSTPQPVQAIIDALIDRGMTANKFYPDSVKAMQQRYDAGATITQFIEGYDVALHTTQGRGFGVNYLIKAVDGLLVKAKQAQYVPASPRPRSHTRDTVASPLKERVYENDFRNAISWAGDLLKF